MLCWCLGWLHPFCRCFTSLSTLICCFSCWESFKCTTDWKCLTKHFLKKNRISLKNSSQNVVTSVFCGMVGTLCHMRQESRSVPAALPYAEFALNSDVIPVFTFGSRVGKFKFWESGNERATELICEGVRMDRLAGSRWDCSWGRGRWNPTWSPDVPPPHFHLPHPVSLVSKPTSSCWRTTDCDPFQGLSALLP